MEITIKDWDMFVVGYQVIASLSFTRLTSSLLYNALYTLYTKEGKKIIMRITISNI